MTATADTIDHTPLRRLLPEADADRNGGALAHTAWLQEKLAASLADPRPNLTHRQVMDQAQALIDAKRKPHAAPATA